MLKSICKTNFSCIRFLPIISLFIGIQNFQSQNFQTIQSNSASSFLANYNSYRYIFSSKQDSVALENSDSVFFSYEQIHTANYNSPDLMDFSNICVSKDTWTGKKIIIKPNGFNVFINQNSDSIVLNTQAILGESWVMFNNGINSRFIATVSDISSVDVLGVTEIVKQITIELRDTLNTVIYHPFNGKTIEISDNLGFVKAYHFYAFPNDTTSFQLCGKRNPDLGLNELTNQEAYNLEVGDVFKYLVTKNHIDAFYSEYDYFSNYNLFLSVINKTINPDSYVYSFSRIRTNPLRYDTISQTIPFTNFNTELLQGEINIHNYFDGFQTINYNNLVFNYLDVNNVKFRHFESKWNCDEVTGSSYDNLHQENLGSITDGLIVEDLNVGGSETKTTDLISYNTSFESLNNPFSNDMITSTTSSSCTGLIQFNAAVVATSYLWDFGDGFTSNDIHPQHNYTTSGVYSISLTITTASGDVFMLSRPNMITIGGQAQALSTDFIFQKVNTCNEVLFTNTTPYFDTIRWTFPDLSTSILSQTDYIFPDTGQYTVRLHGFWAMCSKFIDKNIAIINTISLPTPAFCPESNSTSNSFLKLFEFNTINIQNWDDNYDDACKNTIVLPNQTISGSINAFSLEYYNYDPYSTVFGKQFDIWIDYNNNGNFELSEKLISSSCPTESDVNTIPPTSFNIVIPNSNVVFNQNLRMRVGIASYGNQCSNENYDFSIFIAGYAPQTLDDINSTTQNLPVSFNIITNDSDIDGTLDLTTIDLDQSQTGIQNSFINSAGSFAVSPIGTLTFTPSVNFVGTASVSYTINDNLGLISNLSLATIEVFQSSSILEAQSLSLLIFKPNPTVDFIYIENEYIKTIDFYNLDGKFIFSSNIGNGKIDFSDYKPGTYFAKILFKDGSYKEIRFIKL